MFHLEQEEYAREKIQWSQIKFVDNQVTIDLIEDPRQPSLFKILDEECMIKGTDQGLYKKYSQMLTSNKSYKRPSKFNADTFIIKHYAGEVEYEIDGFVEKNKDTVSDLITQTLAKSTVPLIAKLFQPKEEEKVAEPAKGGKQPFGASNQRMATQGSGLKGNSLSNQFRQQLIDLVTVLKESSPRYIRCIKPNSKFSPDLFESFDVAKQLRCAGMLEAIRIRKAGYAIRVTCEDFAKRYIAVLGKKVDRSVVKANTSKQNCELIFKELIAMQKTTQTQKIVDPGAKKWQIGVSKVFMKEEVRSLVE